MLETFHEDVIPGIRKRYAPAAFWSGHRAKAEGEATEDLIDAITRERTRMSYEAEESALDRALQAAGMGSPTIRGYGTGLNLGEMQRGITEEGVEAERGEWLRQRGERNRWIQQVTNALGLQGQDPYAIGDPGSTPAWQDILGDVAGSAAGSLTSHYLGGDYGGNNTTTEIYGGPSMYSG